MALYRNKYRIESNRWKYWDYSAPGSYFLTVCTVGFIEIFGRIENGKMVLSEAGKIAAGHFVNIPTYHKRAYLDVWVVMPNHIHCIITLGGYNYDNGVSGLGDVVVEKIHEFSLPVPIVTPKPPLKRIYPIIPIVPFPMSSPPTEEEIKTYRKLRRRMLIPKIMGKFKMQTSKQINLLNDMKGNKNWQLNYHDHIIPEEKTYHTIKRYIIKNPLNWKEDGFYNR